MLILLGVAPRLCRAQTKAGIPTAAPPPDNDFELTVPMLYDPPFAPWPAVQVSLDGKEPMLFMLDTGTDGFMVLNEWAAAQLKLPMTPDEGNVNGIQAHTAMVEKLSYTGVRADGAEATLDILIHPQRVHVLDLQYMDQGYAPSGYGGLRLAGVIGAASFHSLVARFDFAANTLTLATHAYAEHHAVTRPAGTMTLPLQPCAGRLCTALQVADGPPAQRVTAPLIIDTGSPFTSIPEALAAAAHPVGALKRGHKGVDNVFYLSDVLLLDNLSLGGSIAPAIVAVTVPQGQACSLGLDVLARSIVTLDIERQVLLLEPLPAGARRPLLPGASGLRVQAPNGLSPAVPTAGIAVAAVEAGSPAARAGIQAGDFILNVDGRSLQGVPAHIAQDVVDGAAGTIAVVLVAHPNGVRALKLWRRGQHFPPYLNPSIGMTVSIVNHQSLVVSSLAPGSIAQQAGVHVGDVILQINEMRLEQVSSDEASANLTRPEVALILQRAGQPAPLRVLLKASK